MRRWETKGKNKKNRTAMGTTDYDIPMFGYRSAFLIAFGSTISLMIGSLVDSLLPLGGYHIIHAIIGGLGIGFCFGFSRYFIESNKRFCKSFWISFSVVSLIGAIFVIAFFNLGLVL